jgi:hypothetical protein
MEVFSWLLDFRQAGRSLIELFHFLESVVRSPGILKLAARSTTCSPRGWRMMNVKVIVIKN